MRAAAVPCPCGALPLSSGVARWRTGAAMPQHKHARAVTKSCACCGRGWGILRPRRQAHATALRRARVHVGLDIRVSTGRLLPWLQGCGRWAARWGAHRSTEWGGAQPLCSASGCSRQARCCGAAEAGRDRGGPPPRAGGSAPRQRLWPPRTRKYTSRARCWRYG